MLYGWAVSRSKHESFFTAAHFMRPAWGGTYRQIDDMARRLAELSKAREGRGLYARIYWYLDDVFYGGKLFKETEASWPDMKAGFEDIVQRYPVPWNLNAHAYFACLAGDDAAATAVLQRIAALRLPGGLAAGGMRDLGDCRARLGVPEAP